MDLKYNCLKFLGLLPSQRLKIWLCGSVPEKEEWSHDLVDRDILEFVSVFSSLVFMEGGTIVHGSHPSFTPVLVRQAQRFASDKGQLQLFISERWFKEAVFGSIPYTKIVPSIYGKDTTFQLASSLSVLRKAMVAEVNSAVFIGGKLHKDKLGVPTLDEEMTFAQLKKIPSFVIGGVDGFAKSKVKNDLLVQMNPQVPLEVITEISNEEKIVLLPGRILKLLKQLG